MEQVEEVVTYNPISDIRAALHAALSADLKRRVKGEGKWLFVHDGKAYQLEVQTDTNSEPPWENDDDGDSAVVPHRITRDDDERYLELNRNLVFDRVAVLEHATRDNWGPTPEQATEQLYDRYRRYVDDLWHYVGFTVYDEDMKYVDSCWGFESDCMEYLLDMMLDALP